MKTLLRWIFMSLFGCHHRHVSRVFTIQQRTYQVCCDCGEELAYSWERMQRVGSSIPGSAYAHLAMDWTYRSLSDWIERLLNSPA
jgi:hypothetical protein